MVESTALEMRQVRKGLEGSTPSLSAKFYIRLYDNVAGWNIHTNKDYGKR